MKKLIGKWYFILGMICLCGFLVGFLGVDLFSQNAEADKPKVKDSGYEMSHHASVFKEDAYQSLYNEEKGILRVQKKSDMVQTNAMYNKSEAKELTKAMLGNRYELRLIESDQYGILYEEYKDGRQTGGLALYTLDESGYIIEAYFREGKAYDIDEDKVISHKEAYQLGIQHLKTKYGEDTEIQSDYEDCEIRTYYNPQAEKLCYEIKNVEGVVQKAIEIGIDTVHFDLMISLDGSYVAVASTLGY